MRPCIPQPLTPYQCPPSTQFRAPQARAGFRICATASRAALYPVPVITSPMLVVAGGPQTTPSLGAGCPDRTARLFPTCRPSPGRPATAPEAAPLPLSWARASLPPNTTKARGTAPTAGHRPSRCPFSMRAPARNAHLCFEIPSGGKGAEPSQFNRARLRTGSRCRSHRPAHVPRCRC